MGERRGLASGGIVISDNMIDYKCVYHHEGCCLKGLSGTPCELQGCIAHTDTGYLPWNDMSEKEKSDFLYNLSHQ